MRAGGQCPARHALPRKFGSSICRVCPNTSPGFRVPWRTRPGSSEVAGGVLQHDTERVLLVEQFGGNVRPTTSANAADTPVVWSRPISCSPPPTICSLPSWSATARVRPGSATPTPGRRPHSCALTRPMVPGSGSPGRVLATRVTGDPVGDDRDRPAGPLQHPRTSSAVDPRATCLYLAQSPTEQMTLSIPDSSSRLMKMTPGSEIKKIGI